MSRPTAVVVGVGAEQEVGAAVCRRFAKDLPSSPPPRRACACTWHVVIDGGINGHRLRSRRPQIVDERGEDGLLGIDAIAETYWQIHRQSRSAWTQEVDLRPFKETF